MADFEKPVKLTVSDPDSGEIFETRILANDYAIITAGNRYVKSIQIMGRTHMLAVAVEKRVNGDVGGSRDGT